MSGVEPGPNGTMILTLLVGQSCAAADAAAIRVQKSSAGEIFQHGAFRSFITE